MKIGSTLDTFGTAEVAARSPARATGTTTATLTAVPATAAVDKVAVSAAAAQMNDHSGDFDSAKVDAIRQAIREGRFTVNPEAIADKLIADATSMLSPRNC